jgi:uncharacterized protein YyaL (SSP411 family)
MNENFLPIKVDREERPDIDSIYMQALQMLTGQGGWPLNIFLTPTDLVPFVGGTYFPVEPRYGRPGFLEVLQKIRRFYDTEKSKLDTLKTEMLNGLRQSIIMPETQELDREVLQTGMSVSAAIIGDRGSHQCFPMIPYSAAALRATRFNFEFQDKANIACQKRALNLALGGIYDHVAGGFHRYTVDPTWTVPHFEKMLYDNGQILEYLADLWSAGMKEPALKRAVDGTVKWLKREMTAPAGYFYAAQDADSFASSDEVEPEEGVFYVWTYQELKSLLTAEEFTAILENFTVTSSGNFEGQNVLQRQQPGELSETVETALAKLFEVRYGAAPDALETFPPARNNSEAKGNKWPGRIPAVTDTKMIAAWNSLTISGLARAAVAFNSFEYLELAVNAANFLLENQFVGGRFHRLNYEGQAAVMAQSEDYALFVKALLDLQQASLVFEGEEKQQFWLEKAVAVQGEFDEYLWSLEAGGYFNTAASGDLLMRERSYTDNATPAANGVAIANLIRLSLATEDLQYLDRAESGLKAFSAVMKQTPQACPSLFVALDWYRNQTLVRTNGEEIKSLIAGYFPAAVYKKEASLEEGVTGLVCQGLVCKKPALSEEQLLEQLLQSQTRW